MRKSRRRKARKLAAASLRVGVQQTLSLNPHLPVSEASLTPKDQLVLVSERPRVGVGLGQLGPQSWASPTPSLFPLPFSWFDSPFFRPFLEHLNTSEFTRLQVQS